MALPLFLFDLVPVLGRAIVKVWRQNVRESRTVFRTVAHAWKSAAYI